MQHPLKPDIIENHQLTKKKMDLLLKLVFSPFKLGYRLRVFVVKEDMFFFFLDQDYYFILCICPLLDSFCSDADYQKGVLEEVYKCPTE